MNKLNLVYVFFNDISHSYVTDLSSRTDFKSVKDYFYNTVFDVGVYPTEVMKQCVGICFKDTNNGTIHFHGVCSIDNLEKYELLEIK